jgi:hypothetical protein
LISLFGSHCEPTRDTHAAPLRFRKSRTSICPPTSPLSRPSKSLNAPQYYAARPGVSHSDVITRPRPRSPRHYSHPSAIPETHQVPIAECVMLPIGSHVADNKSSPVHLTSTWRLRLSPHPAQCSVYSSSCLGVCVLLLQDLLQSCSRGGGRRVEDMCYERRRAESCVD